MQKHPYLFTLGITLSAVALQGQQVTDPNPDPIPRSDFGIELEHYVTIPASRSSDPLARINHLKEVPGFPAKVWVNDLEGKLHVIESGTVTEYLDFEAEVADLKTSPGLGTGFTSIALHPQFRQNGKFYTAHMADPGSGTANLSPPQAVSYKNQGVIIEWTADDPSANQFSGSRRELLRVEIPDTIHGLQEIAFNPTVGPGDPDYGMLYICSGEGKSMLRNELANTGTPQSYLGTILRIDPSGTGSSNGEYGIPDDNPWADSDEGLGEVWCYGFRNPHRISWDPQTGEMYCGDIGERNIEEINLIEPGNHYGWPYREGPFELKPSDSDNVYELPADDSGYTYPVAWYDHDEGFAIVGGYVYRQNKMPELNGHYVFGDIKGGTIYHVPVDQFGENGEDAIRRLRLHKTDGSLTNLLKLTGSSRADLRFGRDAAGELYVLTKQDGKIYRMRRYIRGDRGPGMYEHLELQNGWVHDAEQFGWLFTERYPFVYSMALSKYFYIDEPAPWSSGTWIYVKR